MGTLYARGLPTRAISRSVDGQWSEVHRLRSTARGPQSAQRIFGSPRIVTRGFGCRSGRGITARENA